MGDDWGVAANGGSDLRSVVVVSDWSGGSGDHGHQFAVTTVVVVGGGGDDNDCYVGTRQVNDERLRRIKRVI